MISITITVKIISIIVFILLGYSFINMSFFVEKWYDKLNLRYYGSKKFFLFMIFFGYLVYIPFVKIYITKRINHEHDLILCKYYEELILDQKYYENEYKTVKRRLAIYELKRKRRFYHFNKIFKLNSSKKDIE
jgi:hypothetical protein